MPKLTVEGYGTFEVPADKRLVLAIEQDAKVDIMHACGGNARCTTCRVEFIEGEPTRMTVAEKERLTARALTGVRLSCQILCDHDMTVRAISRSRARAVPIRAARPRRRSRRRPNGTTERRRAVTLNGRRPPSRRALAGPRSRFADAFGARGRLGRGASVPAPQ